MALSLYLETLANKWLPTRWSLPEAVVDLTGRTVIVTGGNTGLGLEAAKMFYAMNPERLILAVRTVGKGEEAKRVLEAGSTSNASVSTSASAQSKPQVDVWELDMASFESVKTFASKCKTDLKRIDVFLANAGVNSLDWTTTGDGWEVSLQTNVLSTFLLATLVTPILVDTAKLPAPKQGVALKPHLVIVASDTHVMAKFKTRNESNILSALNSKEHFDGQDRYPDTKLIDIFMTREMGTTPQLRQGASGIVICSVNPGFCRSQIMREFPSTFVAILYAIMARTAREGAKNLVWSSLVDDIPQGSYISSCQVTRTASFVRSKEGEQVQKKLWNELGAVLTPIAPEIAPYWSSA
ncbi:hypothetical protein FRC19_011801 [Serendipita sp. 401]|nr:hypothetical protein FRC19_011801 [Serendipita sp. 401]KAG9051151.1 hypothetical protein FS842_011250 [Serendipita sp. 407]